MNRLKAPTVFGANKARTRVLVTLAVTLLAVSPLAGCTSGAASSTATSPSQEAAATPTQSVVAESPLAQAVRLTLAQGGATFKSNADIVSDGTDGCVVGAPPNEDCSLNVCVGTSTFATSATPQGASYTCKPSLDPQISQTYEIRSLGDTAWLKYPDTKSWYLNQKGSVGDTLLVGDPERWLDAFSGVSLPPGTLTLGGTTTIRLTGAQALNLFARAQGRPESTEQAIKETGVDSEGSIELKTNARGVITDMVIALTQEYSTGPLTTVQSLHLTKFGAKELPAPPGNVETPEP